MARVVETVTRASRIQATLATDEHAAAIAAFYRQTWDPDATPNSVLAARRRAAAENVVAPGEAPPLALVLEESRVIGCCGSIPLRLWDGVAEHPAYCVKGLMVLPAYRGGPIGFHVAKALAGQLPLATVLVVAPAARRLFSALGYTDLGAVRNFVRALRPASIAHRIDVAELGLPVPRWLASGVRLAQRARVADVAAGAAGLALDLAAAVTRGAAAGLITECTPEPPACEELDSLWRRAREGMAAGPVRDGQYLRWRYGGNGAGVEAGGHRYTFITARVGQRLDGVAVLLQPRAESDPRLRGVRVATISDIVFAPDRAGVGLALLGAVERAARRAGADAILATTSHRALSSLLRRQTYLALPGNVHFFLHDATPADRWPQDLGSWWLARGDGGADEVF